MSTANRTAGGWALIAVGLLNVLLFLIHPTRPDHTALIGPWGINAITHTLGVGTVPLMLLGNWALAEHLGLDRPLVRLALCCNLLAASLVCLAGLTSGWITPTWGELGPELGRMGVLLNRACDRGYVAFLGLGMLLAALSLRTAPGWLRPFGVLAGLGTVGWVLSGQFSPSVHAMLALSLTQILWWISAGRLLLSGGADQR